MRLTLRQLVVAPLLGLVLAGCPTEVGVQCPPNTVSVGQFTLNFTGMAIDAGCSATPADGGPTAFLTQPDAGQLGATFCLGNGGSDGGPSLTFLASGKGPRTSDLLADAGFHFTGHTDPVSGTACVCSVAIDESFNGNLLTTPPGPVSLQPDGGLPVITGVSGVTQDTVSAPAGSTGCLCGLPSCTLTYGITGTRF